MSRYVLQEFEDAGIEPDDCDWKGEGYWCPCQYHEGFIEGHQAGVRDNK